MILGRLAPPRLELAPRDGGAAIHIKVARWIGIAVDLDVLGLVVAVVVDLHLDSELLVYIDHLRHLYPTLQIGIIVVSGYWCCWCSGLGHRRGSESSQQPSQGQNQDREPHEQRTG